MLVLRTAVVGFGWRLAWCLCCACSVAGLGQCLVSLLLSFWIKLSHNRSNAFAVRGALVHLVLFCLFVFLALALGRLTLAGEAVFGQHSVALMLLLWCG